MTWADGDLLSPTNLNYRSGFWSSPNDFGADAGGTADATLAFFSAVSSAVSAGAGNGGSLVVGSGTYKLTSNPFKNAVGLGTVPIQVQLNGAKLVSTRQVKVPQATSIVGTARTRCGIVADSAFVSNVAVTSATRLNNSVTVVTGAAHGLEANGTAVVDGVTDVSFNGGWQVTAIPTPTSFTFANAGANTSSSAGTVYIPLVVLGDNDPYSHGIRLLNLTVDCASIATSVAIYSNNINELSGGQHLLVTNFGHRGIWLDYLGSAREAGSGGAFNYRWEDLELYALPNVGATGAFVQSVFGQHRGFEHVTVNTTTNSGGLTSGLDISGAPGLYSRLHFERCANGVLIGNRGATAASTSDSAGIVLTGVTGHSTTSNLVRIRNNAETHDILLQGIARLGATNAIADNLSGLTITDDYVAFYGLSTGARFSTSSNVSWLVPNTLNVGSVSVDGGTAKITIDGTDGTVGAGSIGIAENNGGLHLGSRADVAIMLDNDNNSSLGQFGVYHDGTTPSGSAGLFSVSELTVQAFVPIGGAAGSAPAPQYAFSSEMSLGLYRSASSTLALSYGTFNLASNNAHLSVRTTGTSFTSANVGVNELAFFVGGTSGASIGLRSGGTLYWFSSSASTVG